MNFGDDSARQGNLQRKGQPQALRAMIQGSASTYASMLNATLFPFLLYQQSLAMATRVALSSLQATTGVARQGTEAGDEAHRQDVKPIVQAAQSNVDTTGRAALKQNVEATGETPQDSGVETTEQAPSEVDEFASGLSEPVSPAPETPNTVDELPPSPAAEVLDEPAAGAVEETDRGGRETSSRADGKSDEAYPDPSAPVSSSPAQEGPATAEDPPPVQEEEPPTDETIEELPPPPEVPDVELPPPPPAPQNILDELPPPPAPEVSNIIDELPPPATPEALDEPTTPPTRGEKPRVHVRRGTTAAARRRAEEMGVDLAEVEGTGQGGQITVDDVRRKAQEGQS